MFGRHKKQDTEESLQQKADKFDKQYAESQQRAQESGVPPLPEAPKGRWGWKK